MREGGYNQFCPVAMAAEIICSRWTLLVLRELLAGSTRFNELRRGVPRMSPALLSKRLKDLETAGIVERHKARGGPSAAEYQLTDAGRELKSVVEAVGVWGHRWIESEASLSNLDPNLLMWDMRRNINPTPMPRKRSVIEFIYADLPKAQRHWWLVIEPGKGVDLCSVDPGFEVDLYVSTNLKTMTEMWMGYTPPARAAGDGRLTLTGSAQLKASFKSWLGLSPFAKVNRLVA